MSPGTLVRRSRGHGIAKGRDPMRNGSLTWALLLVCGVGITRFIFRSHYLYDIDSVNFGLALRRFDPSVFQPHPPGYFLYVYLGRLANTVILDPNGALVAISILASCGAAGMIYLLTEAWYGRGPAVASVLLFLASPLCWFHGTVALTYIVEAFFSALIGYLCWRAHAGESRLAIPASAAFAVAAGFRPSTGLLLAPLWLASIRRTHGFYRWLAIATTAGVVLAWFIPMAAAAGGIPAYFDSLAHLWLTVPGKRTFLANPWLAVARFLTIGWIFILCFGAASALAFSRDAEPRPDQGGRTGFIWIWIGPGLLFFTFVFLNYVNSGYLLVLCPPVFAFLAVRVYQFVNSPRHRLLRWTAVAAGLAANCVFFAFAPVYCSYRGVREFERDLRTISQDFRDKVDPQTTLIIGFDSHFLGYRHAGYYLPAFVTAQYPEVDYPDGKRVFVMHGRDTQLLRRLDVGRFERFVFFPLPGGVEYAAYLDKIRARLPEGALSTSTIGQRTAYTGPTSLIPLLFPATAGSSEAAVYTPLHHDRRCCIRVFTPMPPVFSNLLQPLDIDIGS